MTLQELSQLRWLQRETAHEQERLTALESRSRSIASSVRDGLPGETDIARQTELYATAIADAKAALAANLLRCQQEQAKIEAYIGGIGDSCTREIFRLRFVQGCSWVQVAMRLGGYNSPDGVKKMCYRYLRAHA